MLFLGEISYSLYLIQGNVVELFRVHLSGGLMDHLPLMALRTVLALGVTLVLAWLSYRFIEVPAKIGLLGSARAAQRLRTADLHEQ